MEKRNLFIIGNGFDLAHDLPTSYKDFKNWFIKYTRFLRSTYLSEEVPGLAERNVGAVRDIVGEAEELYWLVDYLAIDAGDVRWADFEAYLGKLKFYKLLDKWGHTIENMKKIHDTVKDLEGFFFNWVNKGIDISLARPKKIIIDLLNSGENLILSFNYTETLESVYGINNDEICHIHGLRETDEDELKKLYMTNYGKDHCQMIIGYNEKDYNQEAIDALYPESKINQIAVSILSTYIKDVNGHMYSNRNFFEKIKNSNITDVYSIGFSYSDVDMPYIERICEDLNDKCLWHIECHPGEQEINGYKEKIRKAGYKGAFDKEGFHLSKVDLSGAGVGKVNALEFKFIEDEKTGYNFRTGSAVTGDGYVSGKSDNDWNNNEYFADVTIDANTVKTNCAEVTGFTGNLFKVRLNLGKDSVSVDSFTKLFKAADHKKGTADVVWDASIDKSANTLTITKTTYDADDKATTYSYIFDIKQK